MTSSTSCPIERLLTSPSRQIVHLRDLKPVPPLSDPLQSFEMRQLPVTCQFYWYIFLRDCFDKKCVPLPRFTRSYRFYGKPLPCIWYQTSLGKTFALSYKPDDYNYLGWLLIEGIPPGVNPSDVMALRRINIMRHCQLNDIERFQVNPSFDTSDTESDDCNEVRVVLTKRGRDSA